MSVDLGAVEPQRATLPSGVLQVDSSFGGVWRSFVLRYSKEGQRPQAIHLCRYPRSDHCGLYRSSRPARAFRCRNTAVSYSWAAAPEENLPRGGASVSRDLLPGFDRSVPVARSKSSNKPTPRT